MGYKQVLSTTAQLGRDLIIPAVVIGTTVLSHEGIEMSRGIRGETQVEGDELRSDMKDQFSHISSLVSGGSGVHAFYQFLQTFFTPDIWQELNNKQKLGVALIALFGLAALGYSFSRIDVEHNTLAAGLVGAGGVLLLNFAKTTAGFFAQRNREAHDPFKLHLKDENRSSLTYG